MLYTGVCEGLQLSRKIEVGVSNDKPLDSNVFIAQQYLGLLYARLTLLIFLRDLTNFCVFCLSKQSKQQEIWSHHTQISLFNAKEGKKLRQKYV